MRTIATVAGALLGYSSLAWSQAYIDGFNYPDGTVVPGWTEKRGDWIVAGGRVHSVTIPMGGGALHSIMTKDGFLLKDTVTEITALYEGVSPAIQAGGLCVRENGAPTHTNLVLCKVQDNAAASPAGFDIRYIYEYSTGGASITGPISPIVLGARVRFIVVGSQATMLVDGDMDGFFESTLTRTLTSQFGAGESGVMAAFLAPLARSTALDDFALYDAVLTASGTPSVGSQLILNLQGKTPGAVYQAACSLSNAPGVAIDTRRIPLTPDGLMIASFVAPAVFGSFVGTLDGTGTATAWINIPPAPVLVGIIFYAGFVELAPGAPSGVSAISNDHAVTIVP